MSSDDFDIVQLKGHIKDERGQYYVINDRARDRKSKQRMVQFSCMHVMMKLADFKFPYSSYVEEAFGVNIATLLNSISAATGGKFTFSIDDTFDLKDIKDFGRGNCLQALNFVIEKYGCEVDPDNFVIHIRKQIGMDRGFQARIRKNLMTINFKDNSRALVTRMFSQMKDGLSFIGLDASNLKTDEYALLNAVPGAIVSGKLAVNYLISPYAGYWSNTTNTYYDGEIIESDIEDQLELLEATRKALRESEVPGIDVGLSVADLHKIDNTEPEAFLGDTIHMIDPEMQVNNITARVMGIREYPMDKGKQPDLEVANFYLRDYDDIIADLDKSKTIVDRIVSGGKVTTGAFENFAAQAIYDINNSKTEVQYDTRGIVLRSKLDPNDIVVASSKGIYVSEDNGATAAAAITAAGVIAEKVIGKLGNFITIEVGTGNNVFKMDSNGIYLGHQTFASAPFRVNMAGQATMTQAKVTGTINATGGTFSGNIFASGTITGGALVGATITGALIQTSSAGTYPRIYWEGQGSNAVFRVEGSSTDVLTIRSSGGIPLFHMTDSSSHTALWQLVGNVLQILSTGNINLISGGGAIVMINGVDVLAAIASKANVFSGLTGSVAFLDPSMSTRYLHYNNGVIYNIT